MYDYCLYCYMDSTVKNLSELLYYYKIKINYQKS